MNAFISYLHQLIKDYSGQVTALAAVFALIISALTLWFQRRHNFKSLSPFAMILIGDYENRLEVKIRNSGVGPLIIEQFIASDGNQERNDIISWMPKGIDNWSTFPLESIDGRCIAPNKEEVVIGMIGNPAEEKFVQARAAVRRALSNLTVSLKYRDIYNRKMPMRERKLDCFARRLDLAQGKE
jgi:hypothetical protein